MPVEFTQTYALFIATSVVLPIIVAFVTKQHSRPAIKANVLLALSVINGVLFTAYSAAASGASFGLEDWKSVVVGAIISFVIAVAGHAGYLKPIKVTGEEGKIQEKVPFGLI